MMHGGVHYETSRWRADLRGRVEGHRGVRRIRPRRDLADDRVSLGEHVPYDVLKKQPHWLNQQISDYMEEFVGAPAPTFGKLAAARRAAQLAEVRALAEADAQAAEQSKALAASAGRRRRPPPDCGRSLRRAEILVARSGVLRRRPALGTGVALPALLRWAT